MINFSALKDRSLDDVVTGSKVANICSSVRDMRKCAQVPRYFECIENRYNGYNIETCKIIEATFIMLHFFAICETFRRSRRAWLKLLNGKYASDYGPVWGLISREPSMWEGVTVQYIRVYREGPPLAFFWLRVCIHAVVFVHSFHVYTICKYDMENTTIWDLLQLVVFNSVNWTSAEPVL